MERRGKVDRSDHQQQQQTARPYQLELLDAALEENTIVNLGTGAGKTFIAVMLIRELSPPILLEFGEEGAKRSVFLVTTVPLVKQQAEYIKRHTGLNVGQYTGEMNVDSWLPGKWRTEFSHNQVLVMTMTIFKNLLLQNMLSFSQVNLLVFDECHHAVKNHDYVQIMRLFKEYIGHDDSTRILGLTASLIPSKCKPGDLERKIVEMENTLSCRSQTALDLREVAKYATNPQESVCYYSSNGGPQVSELKQILEGPVNFLEGFSKALKQSEFYEIVKMNLDDCLHILLNLGIWCAYEFAKNGLADISARIEDCCGQFSDDWEEKLIYLGRTHLEIFVRKSEEVLLAGGKDRFFVADKVNKLFTQLGDGAVCSGELPLQQNSPHSSRRRSATKLQGIIFTERRTTAAFLNKLLQEQSQIQEDLRHIKCDYVVGHDQGKGVTYLRKEAKMTCKKQDEVLKKFREGKINLLVSTSVVEEGVDVPKCNLVIRFDFPQNFRAYVQSKGRARARESKYILLIPSEEAPKLHVQLTDYNVLVKELEKICHGRHVSSDDEILKQLRDEVQPYVNAHGATATINSSLATVHSYCQKLPKDAYTILAPDFRVEKRRFGEGRDWARFPPPATSVFPPLPTFDVMYRSTLSLPMNSPMKEQIKGDWFPTKRLADKSAALEMVKKLDQEGELDERLRPVSRNDDSDEGDVELADIKAVPNAGTGRKMRQYRNKVVPTLSGCLPLSGPIGNHLYIFFVPGIDRGQGQPSFGILSRKPLPHVQVPEFSLYDEDKEIHVKICKYHTEITVFEEELEILKKSHVNLFSDVLKIRPSWLECKFDSSERNFLVVPLRFFPFCDPLEAVIDFEMAKKLADISTESWKEKPLPWPMDMEDLQNAIVVPNHRENPSLYEVKEVSKTITLFSQFSDPKVAGSFKDYFSTKYGCTFTDDLQPALICRRLSESPSRLRLLKSRYKSDQDGRDLAVSKYRGRTIELFPEICCLHPISADYWRLAYCVPSVLWRLECILIANHLRSRISEETRIGRFPDGSEFTTSINLTGYQDLAFGSLRSQKLIPGKEEGEYDIEYLGDAVDPLDSNLHSVLRGPDNVLILQALTTRRSEDSIDLERLETLGDSFLKFSTTVFLYHSRSTAHEGKLTTARSRRVGNLNLYRLALRKGIPEYIFSSGFHPVEMWIPPCFVFNRGGDPPLQATASHEEGMSDQEKHYLYHKLSDKGVADCVESLIGAYLVAGGIRAGLKFMRWLGVKIVADDDEDDNDGDGSRGAVQFLSELSLEEGEVVSSDDSSYSLPTPPKQQRLDKSQDQPVFIRNSASVLTSFFAPVISSGPRQLTKQQRTELKRLLSISLGKNDIEETLHWQFKDKSLLLQAVTHASYTKNRVTECYQRLEFLGDAVLDYLVTCYIYSTFPKYGPGEISGLRSALVCNITFAELAVELKLHTALLYVSPSLYHQVEHYLKSRESSEEDEEVAESSEVFLREEGELEPTAAEAAVSTRGDQDNEEEEEDVVEYMEPPKVLGDILESLAGAIFIDSGMCLDSVWKVFKPLFKRKIDTFEGEVPVEPVSKLFQLESNVTTESKKKGPKKVKFTITVLRDPPIRVAAIASTRKAAKRAAAEAILKRLNQSSHNTLNE